MRNCWVRELWFIMRLSMVFNLWWDKMIVRIKKFMTLFWGVSLIYCLSVVLNNGELILKSSCMNLPSLRSLLHSLLLFKSKNTNMRSFNWRVLYFVWVGLYSFTNSCLIMIQWSPKETRLVAKWTCSCYNNLSPLH